MKIHQTDSCEYLTFSLFERLPLRHAVFLRGSDEEPFDVADGSEHFERSLGTIAKSMGIQKEKIRWTRQVHGSAVADITAEDNDIPSCDSLVTSKKGVCLMIRHADCQAALLFDPKNEVAAAVHAGWRGNVQNIYLATVEFLVKKYGTDPKDLLVGIGPSLGPKHAEFLHYKEEFPPAYWRFFDETSHGNLWEIARNQFKECGIPEEQIEIAHLDTYDDEKRFYSYRRDGELAGRHATLVMLK